MITGLTLSTHSPLVSEEFTIASDLGDRTVRIEAVNVPAIAPFNLDLVQTSPDSFSTQAFLSLHHPGVYRAESGRDSVEFTVLGHDALSFGAELGLSLGLITLLVGGIIAWTIKRKRHGPSVGSL